MSEQITGSCLCGAIGYAVQGPFKAAANCHCNLCKKSGGGAFQSLAFAAEANFALTRGGDGLTAYRISPRAVKHFCRACGSTLYVEHTNFPGNRLVPLGSLDDPTCVAPAVNVFCESMLPWAGKVGNLPSFEREPTR